MRFEVIPKLAEVGVETYEIAQPVCPNCIVWGDFGWDYFDSSFVIFELRVDRTDDLFVDFTEIYMQHHILSLSGTGRAGRLCTC